MRDFVCSYDPSEVYEHSQSFHVMSLCSEPNVALIGSYDCGYDTEEIHEKTANITDINSEEIEEIFARSEDE